MFHLKTVTPVPYPDPLLHCIYHYLDPLSTPTPVFFSSFERGLVTPCRGCSPLSPEMDRGSHNTLSLPTKDPLCPYDSLTSYTRSKEVHLAVGRGPVIRPHVSSGPNRSRDSLRHTSPSRVSGLRSESKFRSKILNDCHNRIPSVDVGKTRRQNSRYLS